MNYTMTCHGGGALDVYIEPILSKPLILIVGRSLTAQVLCKLGKAIGYRVSVVASGATRERFPDADLIIDELDLSQVKITPETYVVVPTRGERGRGGARASAPQKYVLCFVYCQRAQGPESL